MTNRSTDGPCWLSIHLYFDGGIYLSEADRLILDVVEPLAEHCLHRGWAERWFFIRYAEGGSHIRFRLDIRPEHETSCREWIERRLVETATPVRAFRWVPYEPEVERYGGERGVTVAEQHFCDGSAIALDLLRKLAAEDRSARLGKATLSMLVLLYVFMESATDAARLIHNYGTNYLGQMVADERLAKSFLRAFQRGRDRQARGLATFVSAVWEGSAEGASLTEEMDRYRRHLEATRRHLEELSERSELVPRFGRQAESPKWQAATIFPSYLHMMNNRLGVTVQEECYLAVVIASTLDMTAHVATA